MDDIAFSPSIALTNTNRCKIAFDWKRTVRCTIQLHSNLPRVGMILVDFSDIIVGMPLLEIVRTPFSPAGCGSKVDLLTADRLQPHPSSLTGSFIAEAPNAN